MGNERDDGSIHSDRKKKKTLEDDLEWRFRLGLFETSGNRYKGLEIREVWLEVEIYKPLGVWILIADRGWMGQHGPEENTRQRTEI